MMDQHQWLVVFLLPLVWSISLRQVDSARPLQTSSTSQRNTWPWFSILPPIGQPTPNLLNFTLPPISLPQPKVPGPKFPSIPPISQPVFPFPPFSQPKSALPSIPPISVPGKPEKSPGWLSLPPFPSWSTSSPPPPIIPSFPWSTPSPPPPATSSFPWMNPTPPLPTIPSFPWNTPSPPPPATPSFPWMNPTPPLPKIPSLPWNTPSPQPPSIPSLPWNTPSPPPAIPSFPWLSTPPPPAFPSLPWPLVPTAPAPPKDWTGSTLPPFGLPPGGPLFPTGIQFTFSNFTNTWLPDAGVKVTWENVITIELSLQLLVEAIFKPVSLIISQFADSSGPESWGWKNGLTDSKFSADVGATCTTLGENGFPAKGLIVVQAPIDNTADTTITWFTVLFNGWSKEKPFNAALDHTPGTFGGFVTNVTMPNLKTFCSHPGSLNRIADKQGQYVLN